MDNVFELNLIHFESNSTILLMKLNPYLELEKKKKEWKMVGNALNKVVDSDHLAEIGVAVGRATIVCHIEQSTLGHFYIKC